jgi:acetoin utilization protein AcuB
MRVDLRDYRRMPPVAAAMTPFPYHVQADDPISEVERLMEEHGIRHVPVQDGGRVIGMISDRDLHHLVNPALPGRDRERIRARDILIPDPYVVEMSAALHDVVAEMARRQIGSAVVVRHGRLAGILSASDVCRVLAEILRQRFPEGDDAA